MNTEEQKTNYIKHDRLHCSHMRENIPCVHDKATEVLPENGRRGPMYRRTQRIPVETIDNKHIAI